MIRRVSHPGPELQPRATALPVQAHPVEVVLRGGLPFGQAVATAFEGFDGGFLDLRDVAMDPLAYVIPGPAQNGHAHGIARRTGCARARGSCKAQRILAGAMVRGSRIRMASGPMTAARGTWGISCPTRRWSRAIARSRGGGCPGAALVAQPDPETGFTLFRPEPRDARERGTPAQLVTLRPNQDIGDAMVGLGLIGKVQGLGSLIGTKIADDRLESYATEILLTRGHVGPEGAELHAASIGLDGRMIEGRLVAGANAVLVTAELLVTA